MPAHAANTTPEDITNGSKGSTSNLEASVCVLATNTEIVLVKEFLLQLPMEVRLFPGPRN